MEPFDRLTAIAAPFDRRNIDTDQLLPARFLQKPRSADFGPLLFRDRRFDADGVERSDFTLNQPGYRGARIIVAGDNFACGSSREHAVWALHDFGIRAVISSSFGDIFRTNATKNGLLAITLPQPEVDGLLARLASTPGAEIAIDLPGQTVMLGNSWYGFDIDPYAKQCLINGQDEIAYTLSLADKIAGFERAQRETPKGSAS